MSEEEYAHKIAVYKARVDDYGTKIAAAQAAIGQHTAAVFAAPAKPKRSKYGAKPVFYDFINFRSIKEYDRYKVLRVMERAKIIRNLVVQPVFYLHAGTPAVKVATYRADFAYTRDDGCGVQRWVIEDVKSKITAKAERFLRIQKHVKAEYGVEIQVVI